MNRQLTYSLLLCVAILGGLIILIDSATWFRGNHRIRSSPRIIQVEPQDILKIRVLRDYWNTFTLSRNAEGSWYMAEPTREPADIAYAARLLETLANLPRLEILGSIADDRERYREYGLWHPSVQVTLTSVDREWQLAFGAETPDGKGVYVSRMDNDEVFITSKEAFDIIITDAGYYRKAENRGSSIQAKE